MWTQETWSLVLTLPPRGVTPTFHGLSFHVSKVSMLSQVRECRDVEIISSPTFHAQGGQPSAAALIREQGQAPSLSVALRSHCKTVGVGIREEASLTSVVIIEVLF